jgi:hypothetical protein
MLSIFSATILIVFLSVAYSLTFIVSTSSNNSNNYLENIAIATNTTTTNISKEQGNKLMIPYVNATYVNATYGVKIQYPFGWQLVVEHGDAARYHLLNVIAEFLLPYQNNYYDANIPGSHNSLRLSVENYSTFEDSQNNNNNITNNNTVDKQLRNIGSNRIGSIGIACPDFDLKSYNRNATLAGSPAYQIAFDYTYLDKNKKATEIWTFKDNKVYIISYVANEDVYDTYVPVVQKIINSFEITKAG